MEAVYMKKFIETILRSKKGPAATILIVVAAYFIDPSLIQFLI
jgi:hypothetical protein